MIFYGSDNVSKYNAKKFNIKVSCSIAKSNATTKYLERNLGDGYDRIELQPRYELIPKVNKQRKTEYIADFALFKDDVLVEVIDVKGMPTEVAKLKAKMFDINIQKSNLHGYAKHLNTQGLNG